MDLEATARSLYPACTAIRVVDSVDPLLPALDPALQAFGYVAGTFDSYTGTLLLVAAPHEAATA
jgi:hypothetical protein